MLSTFCKSAAILLDGLHQLRTADCILTVNQDKSQVKVRRRSANSPTGGLHFLFFAFYSPSIVLAIRK